MIVLAIKSCFFSGVDSYNLGRKSHIFYFFLFFCGEMIKVIYAILVVAIKDLEMYLSNSNLLIRKNAICFEPLVQKRETGKQTADALYYKY